MNPVLLVALLVFSCAQVQAQDAHFEFHSPFGSDGTNQPGLPPEERNALVYDHVWDFYVQARREIDKPLPKAQPGGYSQSRTDRAITVLRLGQLLDTMAQLRAFTAQNPGYIDARNEAELGRIDKVLRSLDLHYYPNCGQGIVYFCDKKGPGPIRQSLAPVLLGDDGRARPVPPIELGFQRRVTGNQR